MRGARSRETTEKTERKRRSSVVSHTSRTEQNHRVDIVDQPEFLTSVRSHIVSDASPSRSIPLSSSFSPLPFLPFPFPFPLRLQAARSGKKQHYTRHAAPTNRRIMLDERRPTGNK